MTCQQIFLALILPVAVGSSPVLSQPALPGGKRATLELATGVNTYRGPANLGHRDLNTPDVRLRSASFWIAGAFPVVSDRVYFRLLAGISGIDRGRGRALLGHSGDVNPFLTEKVVWFEPAALVRWRSVAAHRLSPYIFAGFAGIIADPFGDSGQFDAPGAGIPGPERSSFTVPLGAGVDVRLTPGVQLFFEGARSPHLNYVFRREAAFPRIRRSRAGFGLRIDILEARERRYARRHFRATPAEILADHRPSAAQVHVESTGIKWLARSDAAWISLDSWFGRGDSHLTVRIQENPSNHARSGVVLVTGGGRTETVRIQQAGRPPPPPPPAPRLDVSPVRFNVTVTAGNERVRVSANAPWDAVAPAGWLTVDIDSTGFGIRYAENESLLPRSGFVTVSTSDLVRTIEIVQSGRTPFDEPLDLAPQWLDISNTARTDTVHVHPFGAEWRPVSAVSWLSVEPINEGLIVRSEANDEFEPRIGMIQVVSRGNERIVVVTQAAAPLPPVDLQIEPARLVLPSAAGVDTLNVRSSEPDWTAESDAMWLTVEQTDTTVIVRTDENAAVGRRTTVITVTARDVIQNVFVRQSGQPRPDPIRPDLRIDVADTRDCVLIRLNPVLFERNSTELTAAAHENLTLNVNMLTACPSRVVEIDVALDPDEDDAALKRRERITAIRNYYLERGIPEARLVDSLDESGGRRPE